MESRAQPNDFEVLFRGLSNECPSVFDSCIKNIFDRIDRIIFEVVVTKTSIQQATVVMSIGGWYNIGRVRIAKYVAKMGMESNRFYRLIWMIGFQSKTVPEEFQMQVADILQIPFPRNYDGEEDEERFEELARKIHACLKQQKFLLVHDASWEMEDLTRMGIPRIMSGGNYSMVLAISTYFLYDKYDHCILDSSLSTRNVWDLFWEESVDISDTLSRRQVNISSENVMKCLCYFLLIYYDKKEAECPAEYISRYWFAEGFIGDVCSDLESIFLIGITLLEELQHRQILNLLNPPYIHGDRVYLAMKNVLGPYTYLSRSQFPLVFNSTLVKKGKWREDNMICFNLTDILSYDIDGTSIRFCYDPNQCKTKLFEPLQNIRVFQGISSIPSFITCFQKTLKFLLHSSKSSSLTSLEVSYLGTLENLEVLQLSKASFENLPDNLFEGLHNLRLLDLSESEKILSLPSSLSLLLNLEHLLLGSCRSLSILPFSLPLQKLKLLDLSGTNLTEIPTDFFENLLSLKTLNLSCISKLKFLPMSMSNLVNLKELNLESCTSLMAVVPSLSHLSLTLEVLNLSKCSSLTDTDHLSWSFQSMPNLRALNLNGSNFDFLVLNGCSSLESLNLPSNTNFLELNLSGTNIKKFPTEGYPIIKSLRSLVLLHVKNLCDVNWSIITWLPAKVNWDQCGDGSKENMQIPLDEWFRVGNGDGVFISVCNANIFQSLPPSSPLWVKGLSRCVIYVHPCMENSRPPLIPRYKDIYSKIKPCIPLHERCLEIEGVGSLRKGIRGVLSHTNFLYLHDHVKSLKRLSSLGIENMGELRECWLERCHEMEVVFEVGGNEKKEPILSCLQTMRISNLKKLSTMCRYVGNIYTGSFSHLKHLQLEYCPQLTIIFSSGFCLENLEVLEVKFCARLEEIFCGDLHSQGSLQRLHTLLLLELPRLHNIVSGVSLLSLKKAHIKGCPKLRKLPLQRTDDASSVVVTGELNWWEQLKWDVAGNQPHISFNAWTPFKLHNTRRGQ